MNSSDSRQILVRAIFSFTLFAFIILPFGITDANAQVFIGGEADFEIRQGQYDSAPFINQTPNNKLNIYTPNIRLFGIGAISDRWFVELALQSDFYEGETLSAPFFSMANLNWLPINDSDFMVTAGRFITPYGTQEDRLLSSENPFVHLPLYSAFNLGIDKFTGVFSDGIDYDMEGRRGQSMVYQRGYTQGLMVSNRTKNETLSYRLAATLAPVSGFAETGVHDIPSFIGRMVYRPLIWAEIGLSFSHGPYMKRNLLNEDLSNSELRSFRQTIAGADLNISYLYYSLGFEVHYSRWGSPDYEYEDVLFRDPEPEVWYYGAEFISRTPFILPGSYLGVRGELLRPEKLRQDGEYFVFGQEVDRAEFLFGYQVTRSLKTKFSYQVNTTRPDRLRADVWAIQLNAAF